MSDTADMLREVERLFAKRDYAGLPGLCGQLLEAEGGQPAEIQARLEYICGCAHESGQNLEHALESFLRSEQLYIDLERPQESLRSRIGVTLARRAQHSIDHVFLEAQRCLEQAEENGWSAETAEALVLMATAVKHQHRYDEVLKLTSRALDMLHPEQDLFTYSRATSLRAWAMFALGRGEEGERLAFEAFEMLRSVQNSALLRRELGHFAFYAWCKGELDRATILTEQQLESALADNSPLEIAMARYNLGIFAAQEGNWADAAKYGLLAWQQHLHPQGLVLEAAVLMLLSLTAVHQLKPADALNYALLAQRNMREKSSDELDLLQHYVVVALLANGDTDKAQDCWSSRRSLAKGTENLIEVRWLRRALALITSPAYAELLPDQTLVSAVIRQVDAELQKWQDECEQRLQPGVELVPA